MFGLLGITIYFLVELVRDTLINRKKNQNIITCLRILIILMSITIFSKYVHLKYFDYPTLLIVPLFIIVSTIYLIYEKQRDIKIVASIVFFALLLIPTFGVSFYNSPYSYLPGQKQSRYNVSEGVETTLPYKYINDTAILLRNQANRLRQKEEFDSAIIIYRKAQIVDPKNPTFYFELSDCYARKENLEKAIILMDSAIMLDGSFSGFYNNRGLLYYKSNDYYSALNDISMAIYYDSTNKVAYGNMALVHDALNNSKKACEYIELAEKLGLDIKIDEHLLKIKKYNCE